jgi:hypothetical protein
VNPQIRSAIFGPVKAVTEHSSAWEDAILIPEIATPPLSARAAHAADTYGTTPLVITRSSATNDEIRRLESLISTEASRIRAPDEQKRAAVPALLDLIDSNSIDGESVDRIMRAIVANKQLLPELAGLDGAKELAGVVRRIRQRRGLDEFRSAVRAPATAIATIHHLLEREWWVFGGTLVPLIGDDVLSDLGDDVIPLIRFDAAIHLIVVEEPRVDDLVTEAAGHFRISARVSAALDRARHLVRRLEAEKERISDRVHINCERAIATILIGDPAGTDGVDLDTQRHELRMLNAFVHNVTVMTYEELLANAERALDVGGADASPAVPAVTA